MNKNNSNEKEILKKNEFDSSLFSANATVEKETHGFISFLCGVGLAILPPVILFLFAVSTGKIARSSAASWSVDFWVLVGTIFLYFRSEKMQPKNRRIVELSLLVGAIAMFVTKLCFFGIPK